MTRLPAAHNLRPCEWVIPFEVWPYPAVGALVYLPGGDCCGQGSPKGGGPYVAGGGRVAL